MIKMEQIAAQGAVVTMKSALKAVTIKEKWNFYKALAWYLMGLNLRS